MSLKRLKLFISIIEDSWLFIRNYYNFNLFKILETMRIYGFGEKIEF